MTRHVITNDTRQVPTGEVHPLPIKLGRSATLDAFSRLRVSNPVNLFLNKNIHNRNKTQWEEPIIGAIIEHGTVVGGPFQVAETITGGTSGQTGTVTAVDGGALTITYIVNHNDFVVGETITGGTSGATATVSTINTGSHVFHNRARGSIILQVGASSGDQAVRASHRYVPYVPGKSQLITLTFLFGAAVADVTRRVGYFDDLNGLYFEQTNTSVSFVRRTSTSGSVVNNSFAQEDWNLDRLDGTGESKVIFDVSKMQFLVIDFTWQGVGTIRWGFKINGETIFCHEEEFANVSTVASMSTGSLPVRYEITNTAATAGINIMEEVCSSVVSEGGEKLSGLGFSISSDITPRAVTTEVPIMAIRLKNIYGSDNGPNRRTIRFSNMSAMCTTNNAHFEIKHLHDPTNITATWADVGGGSAAEFSTDISTVTGNPSHRIEEGFIVSGQGGKGAGGETISGEELDQHRFVAQNIDSTNSEMFVIFAVAFTGTSNVSSHISWVEFE
jgi:hypothetical protein